MDEKKKKRDVFQSNIHIGGSGVDIAAMRSKALADPELFAHDLEEIVNGKEGLRWEDIKDLRALYVGLGDVMIPTRTEVIPGYFRAAQSSAFPVLAGLLTVQGIQDRYDIVPTIGELLVTEITDNKKVSIISNVFAEDKDTESVAEGKDFPEIGVGEEWVEIRHLKNGRILRITKEMITENDVVNIINRINFLAEFYITTKEILTIKRVIDLFGSGASQVEPFAYRPKAVGTQLYNTTADNPGTRAPSGTRQNNLALADVVSLETARQFLQTMEDFNGNPRAIPMSRAILLVPDALDATAASILNSEMVSGVENEKSDWGPTGRHRPTLVSSPRLDVYSANTWFLGDFKRQFIRKTKSALEVVNLGTDAEAYLRAEIAFQSRASWDIEVGAQDYGFVAQFLAATTPPALP